MRNFTLGLVAGVLIGAPGLVIAAEVVGENGYLRGWEVVTSSGSTICDTPYARPRLRQIECN